MQFRSCTPLVREGYKYRLLKFFQLFRNFSQDIPETFCDENHRSLDNCPATVFKLVLSITQKKKNRHPNGRQEADTLQLTNEYHLNIFCRRRLTEGQGADTHLVWAQISYVGENPTAGALYS